MGRQTYLTHMEQRLRDLDFQIASVRAHLSDGGPPPGDPLAGQLSGLESRLDRVREKLDALDAEPDCTWDELRAEIETEWDMLVQDFEEGLANLA